MLTPAVNAAEIQYAMQELARTRASQETRVRHLRPSESLVPELAETTNQLPQNHVAQTNLESPIDLCGRKERHKERRKEMRRL